MANEQLQKQWIEALCSGEYKQGKGRLRTKMGGSEHFCCLGVLCHIKGLAWTALDETVHRIPNAIVFRPEGGNSAYMPDELQNEVGLSYDQINELVNENDKGTSFEDISKLLGTMFRTKEAENGE